MDPNQSIQHSEIENLTRVDLKTIKPSYFDRIQRKFSLSSNSCYQQRIRKIRKTELIIDNLLTEKMKTCELEINSKIPEATRRAFGIYNGTWKKELPTLVDKIHINPLFEYDESLKDEFHLYYKRILHYLLIRGETASLKYEKNFLIRSKLTTDVRATLFDWMIKVQQYLHMRTESLHLATSFVDQYTQKKKIVETDYQLVGITALFLAGKVNERIPASLRTLCYLTENSYTPHQVLKLELDMLESLDYDVNIALPHHFLDSAMLSCESLCVKTRDKLRLLCLYLFDLGLTEIDLVKRSASLRCAAAVYLARRIFLNCECLNDQLTSTRDSSFEDVLTTSPSDNGSIKDVSIVPTWTVELVSYTGHSETSALRQTVMVYALALNRLQKKHFPSSLICPDDKGTEMLSEAAFLKYSNRHYGKIARHPMLSTFSFLKLIKEFQFEKSN